MIFLLVLLLLGALALAAFCAGVETGMLSINRMRVTHLAREGSKAARTIAAAIADLPRTTTALLIGNNLAAVCFSSASAAFAQRVFPGSAISRTIWSVAAAIAMLYLCEFLPKRICAARPLRRMLELSRPWSVFSSIFAPLTTTAMAVIDFFFRRTPPKEKLNANNLLRILQDRKDGVRITDFESALISRILVLRKKGHSVTPEALLCALDDE